MTNLTESDRVLRYQNRQCCGEQTLIKTGSTLHRKVVNGSSVNALRKKCPYSELFWSVFSNIRTEYGEILRYLSVFSPNAGKYGPPKVRGVVMRNLRDAISCMKPPLKLLINLIALINSTPVLVKKL